ncbi:SMI1/KNR4 family protein [Sinosporangium siamense]|uniref:SMI1/KNR4 family protein n=1 Tax=Sinosporangium siamense TaxID=1367973 RepID=UPI00194FE5ED|nr:SMI1/KNR4 family protein [Sinosporangium siamense]
MSGSRMVRRTLLVVIVTAIVVRVVRQRRIARERELLARRERAQARARLRSGALKLYAPPPPLKADQGGSVQVLGVPSADDLARYAKPAPLKDALAAPRSPRPPRKANPLLERLALAGAALVVLLVLVEGFETLTFAQKPARPAPLPLQANAAPRDPGSAMASSSTNSYAVERNPARCHERYSRLTVRPLTPAMRRAVNRQWVRIERWLRTNAPRTYASLRPPATARAIAVAEAQMMLNIPDSLRASLLRHNGAIGPAAFSLGTGELYGIRQLRDAWLASCPGKAVNGDYPVGWIPFAERAEVHAVTGKTIDQGGGDEDAPSRTYYAALRAAADALTTGRPLDGRRARAVDGVLRWVPVGGASAPQDRASTERTDWSKWPSSWPGPVHRTVSESTDQ